jgi:hypothetical protein
MATLASVLLGQVWAVASNWEAKDLVTFCSFQALHTTATTSQVRIRALG